MAKKTKKETKKILYLFTSFFTFFMLFSFLMDQMILTSGWWMRSLDTKWTDFRIYAPKFLSAFFTDASSFQAYFGGLYNRNPESKISIAAIDDDTVKEMGYPFKRKYYGELIEKLNKLGVKSIGIDVLFFDPDRDNPESDKKLVQSVRKAGNVVNLVAVGSNNEIQYPIKGLAEASKYLAHPNVDRTLESSGQVRKLWLFDPDVSYDMLDIKDPKIKKDLKEINIPLLAMATYAVSTGKSILEVYSKWSKEPFHLNFRIPVARKTHPGWSKDDSKITLSVYRRISVIDILKNKLAPEEKEALKDGIVLVGSTALGAYDHYPSPFFPLWPGVEVHANAIDNLMHDDFIKPVNLWLTIFSVLVVIWIPVIISKYSIKFISSVSMGIILLVFIVNYYLYFHLYDFTFFSIVIGLMIPFIFVTVHKAITEGREKKWIKNTFGQYLSPKVVEVITKDPSKLALGGEKRDMTVFFLDIAHFTSISEKMSPETLTQLLNKYLSGLTDVILKHDGVVDKYIGDCIMAFWNAPLDQKNHKTLACLAAIECIEEIERLNRETSEFEEKPSVRIGINSGPMVVGNMGSKTRFSYTVMGDSVNLASRLEGANKFFSSRIMVSEYTYEEAKSGVEARYLGKVRVIGKEIPVEVYELMAIKGRLSGKRKTLLEQYSHGIDSFYKGDYKKAHSFFAKCLEAVPDDGPSGFYLELSRKYVENRPEPEWDKAFNLVTK